MFLGTSNTALHFAHTTNIVVKSLVSHLLDKKLGTVEARHTRNPGKQEERDIYRLERKKYYYLAELYPLVLSCRIEYVTKAQESKDHIL